MSEYGTPSWYEQMAKAMKHREHCLNMIDRWETALTKAQEEITALVAQIDDTPTETAAVTEQE
jgi:hypothetical protein